MITSHTPRRAAILAGAAFLSLILAGACILSARADRASGNWGGNTIALQNLWPLPQSYTGTLLAPDGQILWTHTGVVTPYGTLYLTPAVASGVTGTLLLDSEGLTAGAIAHLEDGAGEIGNDVYELKL